MASDGKLSSSELVTLASKVNLDIIAITDHDNISGNKEAIEIGRKLGVKVIPGIEMSTQYNNISVHVLAYFNSNNYDSPQLIDSLKSFQDYRTYRGKKIIENLDEIFDIKLDFEKVLKKSHGVLGRPHLASAIIDAGYNLTWNYIFDNLIGDDSPAYIPNKKITTEDAIKMLKSLGGFVVLAHPTLVKKVTIEELFKLDFDGVEAKYPLNKHGDEAKFRLLANKYNKIITAGSDYHGLHDNDGKHGYIGSCPLKGDDLRILVEAIGITSS